jgi:phage gp46-like protein
MDVQLAFNGRFFDLFLAGGDLAKDNGLAAAVAVSLFTDAHVDAAEIPEGTVDRRGWWGDAYAEAAGDRVGSKLWLLGRSKQTASVARDAETYARQALSWLVTDGIAKAVTAAAAWTAPGVLALSIGITRPDGTTVEAKYDNLWEALNV